MAVQWLVCAVPVAFAIMTGAGSVAANGDYDFRAFDFGDEDTEFFGGSYEKAFSNHETYFPTDYLGSLDLVAATPKFARMSSYVDPSEVMVARIKRMTSTSGEVEEGEEEADEDGRDGSSEEKSEGGVDDYADRYEQFVSRHFRDRDEKRKQDDAKGDGASYEYRFDFGPSDDYERIKEESEAQSRQLAKDPKNCKAHEQDGMVCHVCRDPATDTTSESCSYATAPHHNKFAYVKQKNYNSKDHEKEPEGGESEEDERDVDQVDEEQEGSEEVTQKPAKPNKRKENILVNPPPKTKVTPTKKPVVHHKPGSPKATVNGGGYRYQPVDPRSNKERPRSAPMVQDPQRVVHPTYYDFYTHFFPAAGAGRSSEKIRQPEQTANGSDEVYVLRNNPDEVAKVLADFESRDWSNCKKGKKNDLTCYTCTDSDGVKHEECMYVSESRQIPSRVLPAATTTQPIATETVLKPTKKTHRGRGPSKKKVDSSEEQKKKPTSPKLRNVKPQKLVQLLEPAEQQAGGPAEEHQTVKRTVSIMSHVDERGPAVRGGGRVMHYEHQVTHTV